MARRAQPTPLVLQPEAGGGVGKIAQHMHLLAVALNRCEQFGASLGVPQHPEQHRRVHVLQVRIVGIELDGTAQRGLGI